MISPLIEDLNISLSKNRPVVPITGDYRQHLDVGKRGPLTLGIHLRAAT